MKIRNFKHMITFPHRIFAEFQGYMKCWYIRVSEKQMEKKKRDRDRLSINSLCIIWYAYGYLYLSHHIHLSKQTICRYIYIKKIRIYFKKESQLDLLEAFSNNEEDFPFQRQYILTFDWTPQIFKVFLNWKN